MKKRKIKFALLFLTGFCLQTIAQQLTLATGGSSSDNGGTISYSIGQIVYKPTNTLSGSMDHGMQLPYEIYVVGVNETTLDISVSVYPNPATDHLTVQSNGIQDKMLIYKLYDMQGKVVACEQLTGSETQIKMSALPDATYILNILLENKQVQSFKIIKN